jgi:uncharacterized RDD family membrane protein YckC
MDDSPKRRDPNDATEPLPQLTRAVDEPLDRTHPTSGRLPTARGTTDSVPAGYVHRFGAKPFYLFARFAAFLIDGCGVTFILAIFAFNARTHGSFLSSARGESGYIAIVTGAFAIAVILAFACEALFGTTLGKLVFALHVRTLTGRHVGAGSVLIRTLLYPIDLLLVGLLLAAITGRRQRLGDMLAKTVVSSGSIGAFASVIGVTFVIALAYAQATYAGGVHSVDGFASQTQKYAPGIVAHVTSLFRGAENGVPMVAPSESPTPRVEAASAAPAAAASAEPFSEPPTLAPGAVPAQEATPVLPSPDPSQP